MLVRRHAPTGVEPKFLRLLTMVEQLYRYATPNTGLERKRK